MQISEQSWYSSGTGYATALIAGLARAAVTMGSFMALFASAPFWMVGLVGFFTFTVEGQVYWSLVPSAFQILFSVGSLNYFRHAYLRNYLIEKVYADPKLMPEYRARLIEYKTLLTKHSLTTAEKRRFKTLGEYCLSIERQILRAVDHGWHYTSLVNRKHILAIRSTLMDRGRYLPIIRMVSLFAGMGFGAIAFMEVGEVLSQVFLMSSFTIAAPAWIFYVSAGIAIVGAFAAMLQMYRMITKHLETHKDAFARFLTEHPFITAHPWITGLVAALIVSFCLVAVIGMAAAWFSSTEAVAALLLTSQMVRIPKCATIISGFITLVFVLPVYMTFLVTYSLKSILSWIHNIATTQWGEFFRVDFSARRHFNPFYWMSQILKVAILPLHVCSEAFVAGNGFSSTGWQVMWVYFAIACGALSDYFTDLHFVGHEHTHSSEDILVMDEEKHDHGHLFDTITDVPLYMGAMVDMLAYSHSWSDSKSVFFRAECEHHHDHDSAGKEQEHQPYAPVQ